MSGRLIVLCLAALFCKAHSQLCSPPILPPPCPAPCVPAPCQPAIAPSPVTYPQVINPNPYVTTIIDNSVSNALANALQLLIVSNLIGATVGSSAPLISNLGPLLDSIVCPNSLPVEVVIPEYLTCGPNYEILPPYGPISPYGPYYDIIPPCVPITNCAPSYEIIAPYSPIPTCGPNYELIPAYSPIPNCGPNYEFIPPCSPIIDSYPPPLCGLAEIISPNYFTYTETITPICIDSLPYNGYGETLYNIYGIETISPNFCGGVTEIIPNYINYPVPEICPLNPYYGGFAEPILPAVAAPSVFGCLNEVVAPCLPPIANIYGPEVSPFGPLAALAPNYFGGLSEPLAAEVIFPPAVPAQLTGNYGYAPSSLPCVRVNVEPLPYENCIYNGYGSPIYY